jgi:tRNA-2-methylthio-N6-dimethylallyladenosine synthase
LRLERKDIAITTDIIVGFPTETDKDFEDTLNLVKEVEYDTAFSFKYSPRPLTKAFRELKDDVPTKVKEERLKVLQELIEDIAQKKNREMVGKRVDVLIEGYSRRVRNQYTGRTGCNRVVNIENGDNILGKVVNVRITEALKHSLKGEIIKGD